MTRVALVHDYLTQRGGAERVVLSLARAFPDAPVYTSLYEAEATFPEFAGLDVRTTWLDSLAPLRRSHRLALPLLAPAFSRLEVDADVAFCSSSGWAHGARVRGRKLVYCHAPARWLYQTDRYAPGRLSLARLGLAALRPALVRWDRRAATSAHRYVVNSTAVRDQVRALYGIEAEVVPPPTTLDPDGPRSAVDGIEPGFVLCVSRLLPYKNVRAVVEAFRELPRSRLVVVGEGPDRSRLSGGANVHVLGSVSEDELRWLYAGCVGLVAVAWEDFGLTPLEAAMFGKPAAALRFGGYLDTVVEGETGRFIDEPTPPEIREALRDLANRAWDDEAIRRHAERFSEARFVERMRELVAEELSRSQMTGDAR